MMAKVDRSLALAFRKQAERKAHHSSGTLSQVPEVSLEETRGRIEKQQPMATSAQGGEPPYAFCQFCRWG
jgi:hypothetical protein